ncbi:hypothetical protein KIN20_004088 [Parelaphostrongylus tenuis]|uniref:Uncharacterized protein n=1 Tax=Parelaphostrongylus tenuis TaxID=148309 RepID=A0AAD5LXV9_PARTN|nr:hypothetical protein KIN20_004088 [Parelaphostrongylus tenuis]
MVPAAMVFIVALLTIAASPQISFGDRMVRLEKTSYVLRRRSPMSLVDEVAGLSLTRRLFVRSWKYPGYKAMQVDNQVGHRHSFVSGDSLSHYNSLDCLGII